MQDAIHKFYRHNIIILFFVVLIGASHLSSQARNGRLHGEVTDPTGAVISGARVSVENTGGQVTTVSAGAAGDYQIKDLAPGKYNFTSSAKGFASFNRDFEIRAGQDLNITAVLKPGVQQLEIVVQGKEGDEEGQGRSVGVASESNASATVITGKELDYLSDDPTELGMELLELAGPTAGPNGGQIYVDGFASGYLPPKISIREIRINQNPFAADQDKLGYGRVEVFTKPGAGQFHGQFFVDENNSLFNSANPFAPQKLSYNSDILTGDFWGPVNKKLTGYASFQRRNINDTIPINALVLDENLNQTPFRQTLPHPDHVTVGATRFDYQASPNHTIIARYSYTGVSDQNVGLVQFDLPSQALSSRSYEHRVQISENMRISARTENDTRFEFKRNYDASIAANSAPELEVTGAFTSGGNSIGRTISRQDYYELQNHTLTTRGRHIIKFGGRLRTTLLNTDTNQLFNGEFIFDSLNAYQTTLKGLQQGLTPSQIRAAGGEASLFLIIAGQPLLSNTSVDAGGYVQDDWRIRPNLNIGYGLRYETQNVIHDHLDLAPRVSLAWGIGGGKKGTPTTVLRTGFGVFFDRFPVLLERNAQRLDGITTKQILVIQPNFFPNVPPASSLTNVQSTAVQLGSIQPRDAGARALLTPTITQIAPDFRAPYTMQMGIGLEHQFGKSATASLVYLHTRGVHQLFSRNINAPLPGTFDPNNPATGIRPLGQAVNIYQYQSEGVFNQNQLITSLNLRTASRLSIVAKHTLNYANSNVSSSGAFPSNQYDPRADYGRSAFDVRHRISVGTVIDLPRGFKASPFFLLKSGTPFDITLGQDLNGDSIFNDRPSFATDLSRPSVVTTRFGAFDTQPIPGQKIIPRFFGTGPVLYTLNLRIGKTFSIGEKGTSGSPASRTSAGSAGPSSWNPHFKLGFGILAQNILNHVNGGPPVGTIDSPLFGLSNTLAGGAFSSTASSRRLTFQTSIAF